jgi:hypothetical protein
VGIVRPISQSRNSGEKYARLISKTKHYWAEVF